MPALRTTDAAIARPLRSLPGPTPLPFIGNLHQLRAETLHASLEQWARTHGPVYRVVLGSEAVLVLSSPALISEVLRDRPERFRRFARMEPVFEELGFNGVFSAEGEAWRRQRGPTARALDPGHLKAFYPRLVSEVRRLLARWRRHAERGETIDVLPELQRFTVDITCWLAFGQDINTLENGANLMQQHVATVFDAINRRILAPLPYWRYLPLKKEQEAERAAQELRTMIDALIVAARARPPGPDLGQRNLIEGLLSAAENEGPLPIAEIRATLFTILLAGEDTTANTMAWALYALAAHPGIQQRARSELAAALAEREVIGAYGQGRSLPYLDAVAKEAMHRWPVAPIIFLAANEDTVLGGIALKRDTPIFALTRADPPDTPFDPARWLTPAESAYHGYVPFGAGPRFCPGRFLALTEIQAVLAMAVKNFELHLVDGREVEEHFSFTLAPKNLRLRLTPVKPR
jgi:cytochrome P450